MTRAALIMSGVAGVVALGGMIVVTRPARSEAAVYARRIAGTMLIAAALILALFAFGLERAAQAATASIEDAAHLSWMRAGTRLAFA